MFTNYRYLLFAICLGDELNDKGKPIIVYDTENFDLPIAIFKNASTCARFFNTSRDNIQCYISRKILRSGRFSIERMPK